MIDQQKLRLISKRVFDKIHDLLDLFEIEYEEHPNRLTFPCPIHEGDNATALSIFTDGNSMAGNWCCFTRSCEHEYKNTMIGFVRGVLSTRKNKKVGFQEAVDFCLKFLNSELEEFVVNDSESEKARFISNTKSLLKTKHDHAGNVARKLVRDQLSRPVEYYLERGYKESTLDKFDVGVCEEGGKLMHNRAVVPIYDADHKYMIGCVGRSLSAESQPKWLHSKGFRKSSCLYNYWHAKDHILEKQSVILVEGQGDVWRLDEAGIYNAVGIFGCSLSDEQLIILEGSGALNLVIMTDSDEAGSNAKEKIVKKCERLFNIYIVDTPTKDVGDMTVEEIEKQIKPQIANCI